MSEQEFEKYGVEETEDAVKIAQKTSLRYCPWCGRRLVDLSHINVLKCPVHGTEPFEKQHE